MKITTEMEFKPVSIEFATRAEWASFKAFVCAVIEMEDDHGDLNMETSSVLTELRVAISNMP